MSIKKNKNQLIISTIVGVAIAVASYQVIVKLKIENENLKKLTQTSANVPIKKIIYVVPKVDIKKGDKIDVNNLTTKQFPIEIEGAITDSAKIAGLVAIKDIKADSPIVESFFKTSDMDNVQSEPRRGFRSVALRVDPIPYFVKPGTYADVYFPKNAILAQDVKILNVLNITDSKQKYVMLEIKDKDVPIFITALNNDKAVLIQRNRHEKTGYKFNSGIATLPQLPSGAPNELIEVNELSQYDVPTGDVPVSEIKTKPSQDVEVVKSQMKNEEEIEFIFGDKKMIVGAPL